MIRYKLECIFFRFVVKRLRNFGHCEVPDYVEYPEIDRASGNNRCAVCYANDIAGMIEELYSLD